MGQLWVTFRCSEGPVQAQLPPGSVFTGAPVGAPHLPRWLRWLHRRAPAGIDGLLLARGREGRPRWPPPHRSSCVDVMRHGRSPGGLGLQNPERKAQ